MENERLRYNVLSEALSDEEYEALRQELREQHYEAGDIILDEESDGADLFLIGSGRVSITRRASDGSELKLALLHPGDFFGELELIDGRPRSARVTAIEECTMYALSKESFETLLKASHSFTRRLLQAVSIRLRAANNQTLRELARLREAARGDVEKMEQLVEASKYLNSTLNLEEVLDRILATALETVGGDRGTVYLVDEKKGELWSQVLTDDDPLDPSRPSGLAQGKSNDRARGRLRTGPTGGEGLEIRLPIGKGIAGYVAATGDTLNIPDVYLDPRFNPEVDRQSGYRTRTMLCMPMRNHEGKVIGVFQLLNKHRGAFTGEDEQLINALSVHAAIAVENARLYASEREMLKLEKKLVAAREVQRMLLPREMPALPGLELSASTTPAEEVGGDLYDFVALESGALAVCLGDVSGKGLPASLLMANMQATVRAQAPTAGSAAECLRRTNRLLYHSTTSEKFVTAFYGIIGPEEGQIAYANAGQDPPLLVHGDGRVEALPGGGVMLGIVEDFPYSEERAVLPPESVLVIFSDGVTEAVDAEGAMFGLERLRKVLCLHRRESADAIRVAVLAALREFAGGTRQSDDITMVVVKRSSAPHTRS